MIKTSSAKCIREQILLAGVFSVLFAVSAFAQTAAPLNQIEPGTVGSAAPAKGIGPAPANTPQHQILTGALSSQTRQTLQEAMNSVHPADETHPASAK